MEGFLPAPRGSARVVSMIRRVRGIRSCGSLAMVVSLAALFAMTSACSDPKVSMATGPREYTDSDYAQVLERWTRTRSLVSLSELDTLLTVTATYESWDFR